MKRTSLMTLLVTTLTVGAFLSTSRSAAADTNDYAKDMRDFAPVIEEWALETRQMTLAAVAKNELACGAEMVELAQRGFSIADDLEGMRSNAPKRLVPTHVKATEQVQLLATAAATACGSADEAALVSGEAYQDLAGPVKRIRNYVQRASRLGWGR